MAVKFGITAGLLAVAAYIVAYFISLDAFLSQLLFYLTLSVYLIAMYRLADKTVASGKDSFKEIVRPLFICYLVANAIYFLFYYIMITMVNPEIYTQQTALMAPKMKQLAIEDTNLEFKLSHYILYYFQSAIFGFIVSASIAFSKKQS